MKQESKFLSDYSAYVFVCSLSLVAAGYVLLACLLKFIRRDARHMSHPNTIAGITKSAGDALKLPFGLLLPVSAFFNFNVLLLLVGWRNRIHPNIPHLSGRYRKMTPLLTRRLLEQLQDEKSKNTNTLNIITCWLSGLLCFYIAGNAERKSIVNEKQLGVNTWAGEGFMKLFFNNSAAHAFLIFQPIHSERYKKQRATLLSLYHNSSANRWLKQVQVSAAGFLADLTFKQSISLRRFCMRLVLRTSSDLLSLTKKTLDQFYDQHERLLHRLAKYGVYEDCDPELEDEMHRLYLAILKENFEVIKKNRDCFMYQQFDAFGLTFPESYEAFVINVKQYPLEYQFQMALNFVTIGLGGMVHSTANNLDWVLAKLFKDHDKYSQLKALLAERSGIDTACDSVFDHGGVYELIGDWVKKTVHEKPTFGHRFFPVNTSSSFTVHGKACTVPKGAFVVVNHQQCNQDDDSLEIKTLAGMTRSSKTASFGGAQKGPTRACPGARVSLYEQCVLLVEIIQSGIKIANGVIHSLEEDDNQYPIIARVNDGCVMRFGV